VRTAEYQHLAPDQHFRISASYDTSDPARLIKRLGKYARRSTRKAKRQAMRVTDDSRKIHSESRASTLLEV